MTEELVDGLLRDLDYYADEDAVVVEKQQSTIRAVRTALSKASKTGKLAFVPTPSVCARRSAPPRRISDRR